MDRVSQPGNSYKESILMILGTKFSKLHGKYFWSFMPNFRLSKFDIKKNVRKSNGVHYVITQYSVIFMSFDAIKCVLYVTPEHIMVMYSHYTTITCISRLSDPYKSALSTANSLGNELSCIIAHQPNNLVLSPS